MPGDCGISLRTIFVCFAVATILLILGGEGRLIFATADWQIRDAVLADMGMHRWPFDYWLDGKSQLLRAPVGMYLVPALFGGISQVGRDWALLAHNTLILTLLLAQGAALFEGQRARWIALITFLTFSGLDVVGNLIHQWMAGETDWDHIEYWAQNYQYSAHITQIFWVPQHGMAGWSVALTFLLWRRKMAPIGLFAASIPLVALWSPFAVLGALPFAAFASICVVRTGAWGWRDVLLCLVASACSLPAFIYLSADAATVGGGPLPPDGTYGLFLLLEVMPFLLPLLRDRATDRAIMLITAGSLSLMPLWSIGSSNDFQMRASIMALALLALAYADRAGRLERWNDKIWFLALISLGSVTGAAEIARDFRLSPSPTPHCSLVGVWNRQTGTAVPHASYFAARDAMPFRIDPVARVAETQPTRCWDRPWFSPRRDREQQ
ncbi:hypothetical protein A8O16_24445 [Sphingobium sp. 20006FA]|nr:hypothetical protein A8O16_24445 [Sphingobium sp. 20006FA]